MIIGQSIVTSGIKLATMSDLDHGHKDHKTVFLCTYQFTDMHIHTHTHTQMNVLLEYI